MKLDKTTFLNYCFNANGCIKILGRKYQLYSDYERAFMVKESFWDIGCVLYYQPRSPFMQLIVLFSGISNAINLMMEMEPVIIYRVI